MSFISLNPNDNPFFINENIKIHIESLNQKLLNDSATICLNMIVKNESKIIKRLLESVSKLIDTYCICDTGSTDDTVEIITTFFNEKGIQGKIVKEPFVNFEYSRNFAMDAALGLSSHLLLVDADMEVVIKNFPKNYILQADVFTVMQGSYNFQYQNVRIVKNDKRFRYIGVTHEYLSSPDGSVNKSIPKELLFINDYGDGGSKSDKFDRDIRLLSEDLKKPGNENNVRTLFYLANSYHDSGKFEQAIETYRKRIAAGGWNQEVWYSYYRIGSCYEKLGEMEKAIFSWMNCLSVLDDRIENIYKIINYFRNEGKNKIAMKYVKMIEDTLEKHQKNKIDRSYYLFLEEDVYTCKIDYEIIINAYYLGIKNVDKQVLNIMNNCYEDNLVSSTLSNMKFYKNIISPKLFMKFDDKIVVSINNKNYDFTSSSSSIIKDTDPSNLNGYLMNIRYVNYEIVNNYTTYKYDNYILTVNKFIKLNSSFDVIESKLIENIKHDGSRYGGIEDIRIFTDKNEKYPIFIGTGLHKNRDIGVVNGIYNINEDYIEPREIKTDFNKNECEKNWVFVNYKDEVHIIYGWSPLQICKLKRNNEGSEDILSLVEKKEEMPRIFNRVRGSTCGVDYKTPSGQNEIWFVCHIVSYESPRHYYHILVVFDENLKLLRYTCPYKFSDNCIEYCLGLIVNNDSILMTYSEHDSTTRLSVYNKKTFDEMFVVV